MDELELLDNHGQHSFRVSSYSPFGKIPPDADAQNGSFVSVLKSVVTHWLPIKRNVTLRIQQTESRCNRKLLLLKNREILDRLVYYCYIHTWACLCDDSNNRGTGKWPEYVKKECNDNDDNAANKNKSVVYHYPQTRLKK